MDDQSLTCPYCGEPFELDIDPELDGEMIQDCDVCCRPALVRIERDFHGEGRVHLHRSQ